MKIGFFAGTFDTFTIGHLETVKKAAQFFDKLIVGIGVNVLKNRVFDLENMKIAIKKQLRLKN